MRLTITIRTGNAAFTDDPHAELARIIREYADRLEGGREDCALMDYNGNHVGEAKVTGGKRGAR
jgi:hypothetical protein